MLRKPDLVVKYHRKHWWKLLPWYGFIKANNARIFELLISRYGFQWMWTVPSE